MIASKDPHSAHHSVWRSLAGDWLALVCVGLIVKLLVFVLLPHRAPHWIDLSAWDALMRDWARSDLREMSRDPVFRETMLADPWNRLVFIDVNDDACLAWQEAGCSMSSLTPREQLARVIKAITTESRTSHDRPALVVLDIDLAPATEHDTELCNNVAALAQNVPVIVVRPSVVHLAPDPKDNRIEGSASIFDEAFEPGQHAECSPPPAGVTGEPPGEHGLWFASAMVWEDADHVVRRVGVSQKVKIIGPGAGAENDTKLASIGLLGGALLNDIDQDALACDFPGSQRRFDASSGSQQRPSQNDQPCGRPNQRLEHLIEANPDGPYSPVRIRFSVPNWKSKSENNEKTYDGNGRVYGDVANILCHLPAHQVEQELRTSPGICGRANALDDAVVMVGGSYLASGDLRATPLSVRIPGALVHLNAIRAFAQALRTDSLAPWVFIPRDGPLDWILIFVAAFLGACLHLVMHWLALGKPTTGAALINLLMSLGGTAVEVIVILIVTITFGATQLFAGNGVEILTPPLVIACEGLSVAYYYLRELITGVVTVVIDFVFPPAKASARRRARPRRSSSRTERDPG